jgi:hypothetical protein
MQIEPRVGTPMRGTSVDRPDHVVVPIRPVQLPLRIDTERLRAATVAVRGNPR